jgi:hypothetical protein
MKRRIVLSILLPILWWLLGGALYGVYIYLTMWRDRGIAG